MIGAFDTKGPEYAFVRECILARGHLRSRRQIESMLALAPKLPTTNKLRKLNIVLLADKKDHGPNEHDYPLWQKRWLTLLGGKHAGVSSETHVNLYGPLHAADRNDILAGIPRVKISTAWATGESPYRFDRLILRGAPVVP